MPISKHLRKRQRLQNLLFDMSILHFSSYGHLKYSCGKKTRPRLFMQYIARIYYFKDWNKNFNYPLNSIYSFQENSCWFAPSTYKEGLFLNLNSQFS